MTSKKELLRQIEVLDARLGTCEARVMRFQDGIKGFLEAYDNSEMSNVQEAVEHLRLLAVVPRS